MPPTPSVLLQPLHSHVPSSPAMKCFGLGELPPRPTPLFPKPSARCDIVQQKAGGGGGGGLRLLTREGKLHWGCNSLNVRKWWWSSTVERPSPCPARAVLPEQAAGTRAAHPAVLQLDGGPAFPLAHENLQPPEPGQRWPCSQRCEAFGFCENPHLAPRKTPPVCGMLTFQPCFSALAPEGWTLGMGWERYSVDWETKWEFWGGGLGFGSLSRCETAVGGGLALLFLTASGAVLRRGRTRTYIRRCTPNSGNSSPPCPSFCSLGSQVGVPPERPQCSRRAPLVKLQGWLAMMGAADSPRDEQSGAFWGGAAPMGKEDDAPLGSVCWMGHVLLRDGVGEPQMLLRLMGQKRGGLQGCA